MGLIITRMPGEKVMIGDDVVVTVLTSRGRNQVKLHIDAPDDISVDREEIRIKKEQNNFLQK